MIDIQKIKESCEMDSCWHKKPLSKGKMDDVTRAWILEILRDKDIEGKNLLDVGIDRGHGFPQFFKSLRLNVYGVDPSLKGTYVQHYKRIYESQAQFADYEGINFNFITFISTLEHIGFGAYGIPPSKDGYLEARKVMKKMSEILYPDGSILIHMPFSGRFVEVDEEWTYNFEKFNEILNGSNLEIKNESTLYIHTKPRWLGLRVPNILVKSKHKGLRLPGRWVSHDFHISCSREQIEIADPVSGFANFELIRKQ